MNIIHFHALHLQLEIQITTQQLLIFTLRNPSTPTHPTHQQHYLLH